MGRIKCGGGNGGEPVRSPPGRYSYTDRMAQRHAFGHDVTRACRGEIIAILDRHAPEPRSDWFR